MSDDEAANYDEFSFLERYAHHEGLEWRGLPTVRRDSHRLTSGSRLSALLWGTSPPEVVLVHGSGQNAHTWDSVAMALGPRPLVAIDLPGHGHSDWRDDGDYSPAANAAAVAELIAAMAPNARLVVGMSLGGLTTIKLAATRPGMVARAMIIDITPGTLIRALTERQQGTVALVRGPSSYESFEAMLAATAARSPGRSAESFRPGVLHNARRLADGRWAWRHDRLDRPKLTDDARREFIAELWQDITDIAAPLMLVRGGESAFVSDDDAAEFRRRQPTARVELVDGAGHSVQSDRAKHLAGLIEDFLGD